MFVHSTKVKILASNNKESCISRSFGKIIDTNGYMDLKNTNINEANNVKNQIHNKKLFQKALKKIHKPFEFMISDESSRVNELINNPSVLQINQKKAVSHLNVKTEGYDIFQMDDVSSTPSASTSNSRKLVNKIKNNDTKKSVKENNNIGIISINDQLNITDQNMIIRKGTTSSNAEKINLKRISNHTLRTINFDKFVVRKDSLPKNINKEIKEIIEDTLDTIPQTYNTQDIKPFDNEYNRFLTGDRKSDDFIIRALHSFKDKTAKSAKSAIVESSEILIRESPNINIGINLIDKIKKTTLEVLKVNKNVKRAHISNETIIQDIKKQYSNFRIMEQKNKIMNLKGNLMSIKENIFNNIPKASKIIRTTSAKNEKNNKNFFNVLKSHKKKIYNKSTCNEIPINQLMSFNHNHGHIYTQSLKYGFNRINTEPNERSDRLSEDIGYLPNSKNDLKGDEFIKFINLQNSSLVEPINSFHMPLQSNLMEGCKTTKIIGKNVLHNDEISKDKFILKKANIRIRSSSTNKLRNQNNIVIPKIDEIKPVITPQSRKKSPDKKRKMREKILVDMMETKLDGWISDGDQFDLF